MTFISRTRTLQAGMTLASVFALTGIAQAQTTLTATTTATINPKGPRTGASGTKFFNVEGSGNTTNATFGVADFASTPTAATSFSNFVLTLTESDAKFTAPGKFVVYLLDSPGTATSTLKYDAMQTATGGIGTQLGNLYNLGTFAFNTTGNTNTGQVDTYSLMLTNSAQTVFLKELNDGDVRLALGADAGSPATAATYFGSTGTKTGVASVVPALSFTSPNASAAPEPAQTAGLGFFVAGLGALILKARKKSASQAV